MSAKEPPDGSLNLRADYSEVVQAETDEAYEYMLRFGYREGEQFYVAFQAAVDAEIELWRDGMLQRNVAPETPSGRTQYAFRFRTGGRRSSTWFVKYELHDFDGDDTLDTLLVVTIFHGASLRAQEEL